MATAGKVAEEDCRVQGTGVIKFFKERLFPIPGGVEGKVFVRSTEMFFLLNLDPALSEDVGMVGFTSGCGAASSDGNLARTKKTNQEQGGSGTTLGCRKKMMDVLLCGRSCGDVET